MSMAKRKPKHSDSDRDSPYPGGVPTNIYVAGKRTASMVGGPPRLPNQTTFDAQGLPVLPPPQFIGKMPQQLAAYDDDVNVKGLPAKGGVGYDYSEKVRNLPLRFRGMKNVYIKPSFLTEENYFRNADSVYRQAANKSRTTDHRRLNNMYRGIVGAADVLSKYFGKPFHVLPSATSPLPSEAGPKDLVIEVGDKMENWRNAAEGEPGMSRRDKNKPASATQNFNIRAPNYHPQFWNYVFMHEFGHNLGAAHPHEYRQGTLYNSIMSYEAPTEVGKLLPADINYFRNTMGYNMTPQSIRQRIDSTGKILPNAPKVTPTTGFPTPSFLAAPLPKKKNNRGNKKGR